MLIRELTPQTTPQQLFDYITAFLIKQGGPSFRDDEGDEPAYRGRGGRMCAIGCIIPDALYTPNLEGRTLDAICAPALPHLLREPLTKEQKVFFRELNKFLPLLRELQESHDSIQYEKGGIARLVIKVFPSIAEEFGLTFNPDLYKELT